MHMGDVWHFPALSSGTSLPAGRRSLVMYPYGRCQWPSKIAHIAGAPVAVVTSSLGFPFG